MVADSPFGVLDATLDDGDLPVPWARFYRVRPRVPLICRACEKPLHAKISKCGLPFFAHDALDRRCPLTGETLEHRLLKSALAGAVRSCGWHAELEARASDGSWVGDVLSTSPDGSRQIIWEAQLARQHDDDTLDRTARYHASGYEVVWVFDRFTAPKAPHINVKTQDRNIDVSRLVMALDTSRCRDVEKCSRYPDLESPPKCPGHGMWEVTKLSLDHFVATVCSGRLEWLTLPRLDAPTAGNTSRPPVPAWADPADLGRAHAILHAQLDADLIADAIAKEESERQALQRQREQEELVLRQEERQRLWEQQRRQREAQERAKQQEEDRHAANTAALLQRRRDLTPAVIQIVADETGDTPWATEEGDGELATGVSVIAYSKTVAVICPVASLITPEVADRLATITIYVATDKERRNIAQQCLPGQRIVTLTATPTLW